MDVDLKNEKFLYTDKGSIHYKVENENATGDPVVFLHDALGSISQWKDFPRHLCYLTGRKGIIIDRYGHGRSSGVKKIPLSVSFLEDEADDLHHILSILSIDNPILIGSSDGGSIALIYASKYWAKATISIAGHYFNEKATREGVEKMKKAATINSIVKGLEKYHGEKSQSLVEAWLEVWTSERYRLWDISEILKLVNIPALVIQGKDDPYASDYHALSMSDKIGFSSELLLIENAGHFPHLDSEEPVMDAIIPFFKVVEASKEI